MKRKMVDLEFDKKSRLEKSMEEAKIDLGDSFFECKTSIINFKEKINELKMLEKDPENYIHEYFSELRNQIDLEREVSNNYYLNIIDELNKCEEVCKEKRKDYKNEDIIQNVGIFEEKFTEFKEYLDVLKIDVKKWNEVRAETNNNIIKLNNKICDLRNELLLNKSYAFVPRKSTLEDNFGSLKIVSKEVNKF